MMVSSYGRRRHFLGRLDPGLFNAAYAFSPQNTVGEMLEAAIQRVWDNLPFVQPLLNVHDEMVYQFLPSDGERVHQAVKKEMEETIVINDKELTIPVDLAEGRSWGEMEEVVV